MTSAPAGSRPSCARCPLALVPAASGPATNRRRCRHWWRSRWPSCPTPPRRASAGRASQLACGSLAGAATRPAAARVMRSPTGRRRGEIRPPC
ncbi:hypothetical protein HBB16_01015 [Pseudonocardia sp. MCCB 268]|nr:hypothetical protein [Pseudonocardia cytotoxica]